MTRPQKRLIPEGDSDYARKLNLMLHDLNAHWFSLVMQGRATINKQAEELAKDRDPAGAPLLAACMALDFAGMLLKTVADGRVRVTFTNIEDTN